MSASGATDSTTRSKPSARKHSPLSLLRHALCILALMWTGIVNGQPFFFADSTNYIRAADMAVHVASGRTISTVWTERYRTLLPTRAGKPSTTPAAGEAVHSQTANDLRTGLVMNGRSPYIGMLMYLGWALGWFWPFVLLQAAIAYGLIILMLRRFDLARPATVFATTLLLAGTTALPTYNSLLLADGFASFGILAFVLLALPGRLSRWQVAFLVGVLMMSTIAHLTHSMMLLGMTVALVAVLLLQWARPPRRVWLAAGSAMLVAVLALQVTSIATRLALGRTPQLLPLLTARFYMDGPGRAFVEAGCDGQRFQVCRIPIRRPVNNAGWLFDLDPDHGVYMLATPDQRRIMGEEDVPFALTVLRQYPLQQAAASFRNTVAQLTWIDYDNLNQGCTDSQPCWESLPPVVHARFNRSPSGQNRWPQEAMNRLLYAVVTVALGALLLAMPRLARLDPQRFVQLRVAVVLVVAAMLVCSFFGGAVADPQYRYQGRLAWLPVLLAIIGVLSIFRAHHGAPAVEAEARP